MNFPAVTICPDFLPYILFDYNDYGLIQYIRYERHSAKKIHYCQEEYLNDTVDEQNLDRKYTEFLDGIEQGEIDYQNLSMKT